MPVRDETLPPEEGGPIDPGAGWWEGAPAGPPTLTVGELDRRIGRALESAFPGRFWVTGETSGWERTYARSRAGHWYFRLLDEGGGSERDRASISVKMWSRTVQRVFGPRGSLDGALDPADGIVIRALASLDFYAPRGEVGLTLHDLDPSYTLGDFDRRRRELLARLEAEGALVTNQALPLAEVPLRVGLVTAEGSAAHHDVMQGLTGSGLGFEVLFCDARMQGAETGPGVCAALRTLAALQPEVIVLARGGGSRLDLAWFDREDIARAIAACPVPVLTGIGHEIDTAVADVVAHTAFKTPSAAAEFLAERARRGARHVEETLAGILRRAREVVQDGHAAVLEAARRVPRVAGQTVHDAAMGLRLSAQDLAREAQRCLHEGRLAMATVSARLAHGRHTERMSLAGQRLISDAGRLGALALGRLERDEQAIAALADRTGLLDPAAVLARGYAYLRQPDGSVRKQAAGTEVGQRLTAVLRDGELDLRTEAVRPAPVRAARTGG